MLYLQTYVSKVHHAGKLAAIPSYICATYGVSVPSARRRSCRTHAAALRAVVRIINAA